MTVSKTTEDTILKSFKVYGLSLIALCALADVASAVEPKDCQHQIDWSMRKEMFVHGTFHVQDKEGNEEGVFLVNYLPGASEIGSAALDHLVSAKDTLKVYLEGERFWENKVWESITDGVRFTLDTNLEYGFGAYPKDFKALFADFNSVSVKEFGGLGRKALDVAGVVASLVCRTVAGAVITTVGIAGTVLVPAWKLVAPACFSVGEAAFCGVGLPVLKMVWHAGAWTVTQAYQTTPPEHSSITVTWVPATRKDKAPKSEL